MNNFEAQVAKRIPELKSFSETLINLADQVLNEALVPNSDNYGVMGICFLNKQLDHMKGLLQLENSRDSVLIARSMIEGLVYFRWSTEEPVDRPLRWREWAHVYNYQLKQENPELYKSQATSTEERPRQEILEKFYTEKARKALHEGRSLPQNPFLRDWTGTTISKIIENVSGGEKSLLIYYQRFSEWHHWNFVGVARSLDISQQRMIQYKSESFLSYGQAIVVGFQCLYQICELVSDHLKINTSDELRELQKKYLAMSGPIEN